MLFTTFILKYNNMKNKLTLQYYIIMFFSRNFFNNIGIVESVGDGIVNILGLQNVANGEMVEICILTNLQGVQTQKALVLNLGPKKVSAVCLASDFFIKPGHL